MKTRFTKTMLQELTDIEIISLILQERLKSLPAYTPLYNTLQSILRKIETKEIHSSDTLEKIYHDLDSESLEDTDTVSMHTVSDIFSRYGASKEAMF